MLLRAWATFFTLLFPIFSLADAKADQAVAYRDASKINIKIDGHLNEAAWADIEPLGNMVIIDPATLDKPPHRTEIKIFQTERGLYAGVYAYQPADTLIQYLSSRDVRSLNRDQIFIALDNSGKGLYGHYFTINLGDSLNDGIVRPERIFSSNWDGPWYGASDIKDDGWVAEFFIPWHMMAMPKVADKNRRMGFYVSRQVAYLDERWSWPGLPASHGVFMSGLQGISLTTPKAQRNLKLKPYAAYNNDSATNQNRFRVGTDLTWRPAPYLQLSASLAPDFATVDNDEIVINLGALETLFSEKRSFFLEGQSIFETSPRTSPGYKSAGRLLLVNTRRIGAPPTALSSIPTGFDEMQTDLLQPIDLYGAAKITGQQGSLRYGFLAAFEEDSKLRLIPEDPSDSVRRVNVDGQSFVAGRLLYEKKAADHYRAFGWLGTSVQGNDRQAKVQAVDAHYLSSSGRWKLNGQLLHSDVNGVNGLGAAVDIEYVPRQNLEHFLQLDWFDKDLELNDFGYVRRNDQVGFFYGMEIFYPEVPKSKTISSIDIDGRMVQNWNQDGRLTRSGFFVEMTIGLEDLSELNLHAGYFPARWEDLASFGNGTFRLKKRGRADVNWRSDNSKKWISKLEYHLSGENLGGWSNKLVFALEVRPSHRLSLEFEMDYQKRNEWLIYTSGRDFTTYDSDHVGLQIKANFFTHAKSQFSTSLQWVGIDATASLNYRTPPTTGQLIRLPENAAGGGENFTISELIWQAKYRWEFSPLSELIIVYNYNAILSNSGSNSFSGLFSDALDEPLAKQLTVHLRYYFDI